ncbi:MAG: SMI1/KNR4 family protein [Hyphomonadaceae bacterium]|jgi:cell wall assembly regulator SMI1|nr:SMI1/KNR4 family protein [Hyphomonadaceae bacterium]
MFPEITDGSAPTTLAAIERFERDRGLTLPDLYRQFLLATNGGVPSNQTFSIGGMALNPTGSVQVFFGIGVRWPTTELAYAYDLYAGGLPEGVVPIAGDGSGNYVCLDLRQGADRVAFWDKRHFWGTGEWRESDLYHVANSFEEFIAALRPNPY